MSRILPFVANGMLGAESTIHITGGSANFVLATNGTGNLSWANVVGLGASGFSGYSGTSGRSGYSGISGRSGYSGISGWSGTSGVSGYSGISGWSGISGYSGAAFVGSSGYSGASGTSGWSGTSGINGTSGYSGVSGWSGTSGTNGTSGYSGISGWSGIDGASGYSGISGWSGIDAPSGYSGKSGYSGISGISGWSGRSGDPGGTSGYSGFSGWAATPGGSNTQIQYNDAGTFGGSAGFTFDKVSNVTTVPGSIKSTAVAGNLYMVGWDSPANLIAPALFLGKAFNTNTITPGISGGNIVIDNLWANWNGNAGVTSNTTSADGMTNTILYNGNYYVGNATSILRSNNGTSWSNIGPQPTYFGLSYTKTTGNIVSIPTAYSFGGPAAGKRSYTTDNFTTWVAGGNMFIGNAAPGSGNYCSILNSVYGNGIIVSAMTTYYHGDLVFVSSTDGGTSWTDSASYGANLIVPVSPETMPDRLHFYNNTFTMIANVVFPRESQYLNSSDGVTWAGAPMPGYYATSDTANHFPRLVNSYVNENTDSLICYMVDKNGANVSEYTYYIAMTNDGNTWNTSNTFSAGSDTYQVAGQFFNNTISQYGQSAFVSIGAKTLGVFHGLSNSAPWANTATMYSSSDGLYFTAIGNITNIGNSVPSHQLIYKDATKQLLITGPGGLGFATVTGNVATYNAGNNFAYATPVPAIKVYDSTGNFTYAQTGTYNSLGSFSTGGTTLFIKTA